MRRVQSKDTTPELVVRHFLFAHGYRYRLHRRDLPGNPDIVFPSRKKIVFVHGCFWHKHTCQRGARIPKNNRDYWEAKIARNFERDKRHQTDLERLGWRILVIWECETRKIEELAQKIVAFLSDSCTKDGAVASTGIRFDGQKEKEG